MTKDALPQKGGSFTRAADGKLTPVPAKKKSGKKADENTSEET